MPAPSGRVCRGPQEPWAPGAGGLAIAFSFHLLSKHHFWPVRYVLKFMKTSVKPVRGQSVQAEGIFKLGE